MRSGNGSCAGIVASVCVRRSINSGRFGMSASGPAQARPGLESTAYAGAGSSDGRSWSPSATQRCFVTGCRPRRLREEEQVARLVASRMRSGRADTQPHGAGTLSAAERIELTEELLREARATTRERDRSVLLDRVSMLN